MPSLSLWTTTFLSYYSRSPVEAMLPALVFSLIISVIAVVAIWRIFTKAGEPGWAAIVPIYNLYTLFKITWGNGVLFLLMLIPLVNFVIVILTMIKLAKAFGKSGGFAAGLIFLSFIFMLILAFGDSRYYGVPGRDFQA